MPQSSTSDLLAQAPPPLTVSQVNQRAKQLLERQFARVTVVGEVANLKTVSGHRYFSLRDDKSQLPAALFKGQATRVDFELRSGLEVVATGRLTIYPPYGRYQMVVERLQPLGAGALQSAFEELKAKLEAEGLFAAERKRAVPLLPQRVAVVTSPTGAVIRDIVNVATRRFQKARILVVPTRVQGGDSAPAIAAAIERASGLAKDLELSAIIVARGGGSLEDLWGFNDERVARAVAAAPIPVVSGVGHETDFTITDFVADIRAPTPSAAAEIIFPVRDELIERLRGPVARATRALRRDIRHGRQRLRALRTGLGDGRSLVAVQHQRLDFAKVHLHHGFHRALAGRRLELGTYETRLANLHPRVRLREIRANVRAAQARLDLLVRLRLTRNRDRLRALEARLTALSPVGVLERGYAIVFDSHGRAVRDATQVNSGDRIDVRVARGRLGAVVDEIEPRDGGSGRSS